MSYSNASENKNIIRGFLYSLYHQVVSSGGDGDAIWYSRFFSVKDIKLILQEWNATLSFPWEIHEDGDTIHWGEGQEWVVITNDKKLWDSRPEWIECQLYW